MTSLSFLGGCDLQGYKVPSTHDAPTLHAAEEEGCHDSGFFVGRCLDVQAHSAFPASTAYHITMCSKLGIQGSYTHTASLLVLFGYGFFCAHDIQNHPYVDETYAP